MAALAMGICLSSCTEKIELVYSDKAVTDVELKAALEAKGVNFNEAGCILLDENAKAITELDLSGKKVANFDGLEGLVNLTDLKLDGYGPIFDFSILPAQITGVDLSNNEIVEYVNLVKAEIAENGDETITNLRDLKKLYLPEVAKNNMTDLIRYYRQNKTAIENGDIDMQMADAEGKLAKFNTLRVVPDPVMAAYLKSNFSSIFTDDKIDLSKRLNSDQKTQRLLVNTYFVENFDKLANLDGLQYIVNNPSWEGTGITMMFPEPKDFPAIKVSKFVTSLYLTKLNVKDLDLSGAENLAKLNLNEIKGIESIDLRASKMWGEGTEGKGSSKLELYGCKDIKSVYFPEAKALRANTVALEGLPLLATCDLTKFIMLSNLALGNLSASYNVVYPNITEFSKSEGSFNFACSKAVYALQATKDFIEKYKNYNGERMIFRYDLSYDVNDTEFWR